MMPDTCALDLAPVALAAQLPRDLADLRERLRQDRHLAEAGQAAPTG